MAEPDSQTPNNQPKSYLFKLPLELRLSVYNHIIAPINPGTILHITENEQLKSIPCIAPPEDSPEIQHRPTSDPQRRYESIHRSCGVQRGRSWETPENFWNEKNTDIKSSLASFRALILTCKKLYLEGIDLLYTPLTFELSSLSTTHKFLTQSSSLEYIQNLDIGWAVRGVCTYQRPGNEERIAEEYNPQNHRMWIEVCETIMKMPNLRYLRVRFYRALGMRLVERELLEPLMGMEMGVRMGMAGMGIERERFVVELPKIGAGDRKEYLIDGGLSERARFTVVRV